MCKCLQLLVDANLPADRSEPDVIINAYSVEILKALATHDSATIDKLQMRGDLELVHLVRAFITQVGIGGLVQSLLKKFKGSDSRGKSNDTEKEQKDNNYKLRIAEQQTQINTLTIKNRELETSVKELQSKQKTMIIIAVIATIVAVIAILYIILN